MAKKPNTLKIAVIPGDGIGPEVTEAVVRILAASGVSIEWERHDAGVLAVEKGQVPLPIELLDSIRRNRVALKGPITTPIGTGFTSVNVGECTRDVTPSPRARPFTSCVLPAPRSPLNVMTQPRCAARPNFSPSASVSAGL